MTMKRSRTESGWRKRGKKPPSAQAQCDSWHGIQMAAPQLTGLVSGNALQDTSASLHTALPGSRHQAAHPTVYLLHLGTTADVLRKCCILGKSFATETSRAN